MRLAFVLASLGMPLLEEIGRQLQLAEPLPKTRQAAAELIEPVYATPVGFQRIWNALDDYERFVYGVALLEMRSDGYTHGVPRAKLIEVLSQRPAKNHQPEKTIARLAELALLAPTRIWYLGDGFELSETIAPLVYDAVLENCDIPLVRDVLPAPVTETGRELSRDMVRFLARAIKNPPNVTKGGSLYRRDIVKLRPLFRCLDVKAVAAGGQWEGVPFGIYIAVTTLQRLRVVRLEEGSFLLFGEVLDEFLNMPEPVLREAVLAAVLKGFQQGCIHLFGILARWLAVSPTGEWAPVVHALVARYGCGRKMPEWTEDADLWVTIMSAAGYLDEAYHEEYGKLPLCRSPAFTVADDRSAGRWIVQPNFDLLVPEDAPIALHFLAGQLAELVRADVMSVYHIDKLSILRLLDHGWKLSEIEACLADFSGAALPGTIARALRDWVREHERAVIWDVMLVRFQTPELLSEFMADERARPAVVETVGNAAVIIQRNMEKRVREVLTELGAAAPESVRRPGEDPARADGKRRNGAHTKANMIALRRLTGPAVRELVRERLGEQG